MQISQKSSYIGMSMLIRWILNIVIKMDPLGYDI